MEKIEGNIIDLKGKRIFPGEVTIDQGYIIEIRENKKSYAHYLCPGFIDAHVHIESSMLLPEYFSDMVIRKGTVAVVNDPHEIANVLGKAGVVFMLQHAAEATIKIFFGLPSCVPATDFDCAGGRMERQDMEELLNENTSFVALSEMMNVPGVLAGDGSVLSKLELAKEKGLVIDGHAPGLKGSSLKAYISQGIVTDHECEALEEALEKIQGGMKILIREGSAAKNYEALKNLIALYPDRVMFCTDDAHPDDILENGHIDRLVKKALQDGFDFFDVLRIACVNPVEHYGLPVGLLQKGDKADFVKIENLSDFRVLSVYIDGIKKYDLTENKKVKINSLSRINNFHRQRLSREELRCSIETRLLTIQVFKDRIVTGKKEFEFPHPLENLEADLSRDILKIVYINRYKNDKPRIAYIHGFGLKAGAFATTVAHDSHNILAVGCNDEDLLESINSLIDTRGGLSAVSGKEKKILPLPIAGIMSEWDAFVVFGIYQTLNRFLMDRGCTLNSPYMTLAFMSLIVIPELKIGERGLFDCSTFQFLG